MATPSLDGGDVTETGGRSNKHTTAMPAEFGEKTDHSSDQEEGWDEGGDGDGGIAFLAKMFNPLPAANNSWFSRRYLMRLLIPPKGHKPSKPAKDNTYIFLVMEGEVKLQVCEASMVVSSGSMFMIPRGNTYFIENIAERDAKLFFTQAREISDEDFQVQRANLHRLQNDLKTERLTVAKQKATIDSLTEQLRIASLESCQKTTEVRKITEGDSPDEDVVMNFSEGTHGMRDPGGDGVEYFCAQ
ncbi:Mif2/CENP-C like-domain-containing protein [Mycena olivaceomarginata]|nr:Mif2/CENP-C like-domain-containing protein [Mycena olivaceomarginata]KAJ7872196.1 Mif2/CENP-C like-domain-containing protein [Mycena olivaceomarginata]